MTQTLKHPLTLLLALLCLIVLTPPAWAGEKSQGPAPADFVRLVRLPNPTIPDSATPYRGGGNEATNMLDGLFRSEYASLDGLARPGCCQQ